MSDVPPVEPRDAATVLLLREAAHAFEIFMVKRHAKSGFMAGAYVFPGGTLDLADHGWERVSGRNGAEAAALLGEADPAKSLALHVAAIRETFEEAGVLLADGAQQVDLSATRERLNGGADFGALAHEHALTLRADLLTPWSRWVTPAFERRRYDARFFLARAPGEQRAEHDKIEVTEGAWLSPDAALERFEDGSIQLPPPTLRTIEQLRAHKSIDEAFAAAAAAERPLPVQPHFVQLDVPTLALPGDPEHPLRERRIGGSSRFQLIEGRFRSTDP